MKFSIVIPAYNEEQRLPPVLERYTTHFSQALVDEFEILVVVNGSTDRTAEVARVIAEKHTTIRVIEEPERIGKGGAILRGVEIARGEYVGFVDADGATAPDEFFRLYNLAQGTDGIMASRWMEGSTVNVRQRGLRLLSSRFFNGLVRGLLGLNYKDTQCGAKIFSRAVWEKIRPRIGTTRFAFDVDILFQAKRSGFTLIEVPTVWNDVEGSSVQVFNTSIEMFLAIIRMRLLHSPLKGTVRYYDRLLAKPVDFLLSDELFRHTALLFIASVITSFGNIGFQMTVSRALPAEEYALLATFLALFVILARPLGTLSTGLNHYASLLTREGRPDIVSRLLKKWMMLAGSCSLVLSAVCMLFAQEIATFFHLERMAPVLVSGLALPAIFIAPILGGALQGMQRFGWIALTGIANALGRVVFGGLLVWFLFPACGWAWAGHVGGMYLAVVIGLLALFPVLLKGTSDTGFVPSMRLYLAQCFLIQISVAVLMTGDVVMVKHFLPENTDFAYAATLGRMVAFMAAAVAMAMFPKVSSSGGALTRKHRQVYLRSQLYTGGLVGASLSVCLLFPAPLLHFLFRIAQPGAEIISYTRWMAVVMATATLLNINVFLLMAQRRFRLLTITVLCAVFYGIGVYFYHGSANQIMLFAGIANLVALIVTTVGIFISKPEKKN